MLRSVCWWVRSAAHMPSSPHPPSALKTPLTELLRSILPSFCKCSRQWPAIVLCLSMHHYFTFCLYPMHPALSQSPMDSP